MKRSEILFWLVIILFIALVSWLITTGRLADLAGQFVDGYWRFVERLPAIHFPR